MSYRLSIVHIYFIKELLIRNLFLRLLSKLRNSSDGELFLSKPFILILGSFSFCFHFFPVSYYLERWVYWGKMGSGDCRKTVDPENS